MTLSHTPDGVLCPEDVNVLESTHLCHTILSNIHIFCHIVTLCCESLVELFQGSCSVHSETSHIMAIQENKYDDICKIKHVIKQ